MTKFNYGFSFNTCSKKLNVTSGLYPVFDSLFQQIRQIMLSPECRGRINSDKIKYLTFTFNAYHDSWGTNATVTLLNSKDLSFNLNATLSWHKGDAYLQEYGPKIKLDLYFSGKFYKTNKIYLSPQFVLNIERTLNYLCNLQKQDNPDKLTHLSNVFEEYRRRLYNWTRLIEYSHKTHESKQGKRPRLNQKLKENRNSFILDSHTADNLESILTDRDQTNLADGFYRAELNGKHITKDIYNITKESQIMHRKMQIWHMRTKIYYASSLLVCFLLILPISNQLAMTAPLIRQLSFAGIILLIAYGICYLLYLAYLNDKAADAWHFGGKAHLELAQGYCFYRKCLKRNRLLKRPYYGLSIAQLRDFNHENPLIYRAIYLKLMMAYCLGYGKRAVKLFDDDKLNHDFRNLEIMLAFDPNQLKPDALVKVEQVKKEALTDLDQVNSALNQMLKPYMQALLLKKSVRQRYVKIL